MSGLLSGACEDEYLRVFLGVGEASVLYLLLGESFKFLPGACCFCVVVGVIYASPPPITPLVSPNPANKELKALGVLFGGG